MAVVKYEQPKPLKFIKGVTEYGYPDGFIYPVLSAFRKYIDHRGEWSWKTDPLQIWEEKKVDVASAMKDAVNVGNANQMGKAGITWRVCYDAL